MDTPYSSGGRVLGQFLRPWVDVAFQHHPQQVAVTGEALANHILEGNVLPGVVFVGVAVAAIHHDTRCHVGLAKGLLRCGNGAGVEIGAACARRA